MLKESSSKSFRAIISSISNVNMTLKGIQGTLNLYGKHLGIEISNIIIDKICKTIVYNYAYSTLTSLIDFYDFLKRFL